MLLAYLIVPFAVINYQILVSLHVHIVNFLVYAVIH